MGEPLRFRLVDMPGYGYAKVSKAMQEKWDLLIKDYLRGRPNLRAGTRNAFSLYCEVVAQAEAHGAG